MGCTPAYNKKKCGYGDILVHPTHIKDSKPFGVQSFYEGSVGCSTVALDTANLNGTRVHGRGKWNWAAHYWSSLEVIRPEKFTFWILFAEHASEIKLNRVNFIGVNFIGQSLPSPSKLASESWEV